MGSKATTPRLKVSSDLEGIISFTFMTAWAPFRLPSRRYRLDLGRASGCRVACRDRGVRFRCMGRRTSLEDLGDLALGREVGWERWLSGGAAQ